MRPVAQGKCRCQLDCFIVGVENEGAPGIDCKTVQDAFVILARNRARLPTFPLDEADNRSAQTHWPSSSGRPRRSRGPWRTLVALFAPSNLLFSATRHKHGQQHGSDEPPNLHSLRSPIISWGQKKGPPKERPQRENTAGPRSVPSAEGASAPNAIPRRGFGSRAGSNYR